METHGNGNGNTHNGGNITAEKARPFPLQARQTDHPEFNTPGAGLWAMGQILVGAGVMRQEVAEWNYYNLTRDRYLRRFSRVQPHFSGALYSMNARLRALRLEVKEGGRNQQSYAREVIQDCEYGGGHRRLLGKWQVDYHTQENGAFVQLVGGGNPLRPIKGKLLYPYMLHMDSQCCWRTFDNEFPVVYVNPLNYSFHRIHHTRVIMSVNFEQPDELARGQGFCALSRALSYVQYMRDVMTYKSEKVSGRFTRAIITGSGINAFDIGQTLQAAEENDTTKGFVVYKGIPILARASGEGVKLDMLDLASVGDGFDFEKEITLYLYAIALAFGVDAREFWPATVAGATKADATIQHLKAQGKGIGDMIEDAETVFRLALPDVVVPEFDFTDDDADRIRAEISEIQQRTSEGMIRSGVLAPDEARRWLIREGVIDTSILNVRNDRDDAEEGVDDSTAVEDTSTAVETTDTTTNETDTQAIERLQKAHKARAAWLTDYVADMLLVEAGSKDFDTARERLARNMENASVPTSLRNQEAAQSRFATLFTTQLRAAGQLTALDAMRDAGIKNPVLTADDRGVINEWADSQRDYVDKYTANLFAATVDDSAFDRGYHAELWANVALRQLYYTFLARYQGKQLKTWVLGGTVDHCNTCASNAGKTKTMQEWIDGGVYPGHDTECGGYNCLCDLVDA